MYKVTITFNDEIITYANDIAAYIDALAFVRQCGIHYTPTIPHGRVKLISVNPDHVEEIRMEIDAWICA